jgi:hypothetical protein
MTDITLDAELARKLHKLSQPVNLRDPAGRLVGRFLPMLEPAQYEGLEPQISKEELHRRKQSKGKTYTAAEVLAHLKKR